MYLIHIKDILKNQEFIYNINPNETFDFKNCITFLINQLSDQNKIKYDIFENYSEIYNEIEFNNRGWIWSSTEKRKNILYILTKIKILNTDNKLQSTSTQTNTVKTDTVKTNTVKHIENIYDNLNFLREESINTPYYDYNYLNNNRINTQLSSGYAKNPIIPMWPDNLITELEEKFSKLNFGLNHTNPNYF